MKVLIYPDKTIPKKISEDIFSRKGLRNLLKILAGLLIIWGGVAISIGLPPEKLGDFAVIAGIFTLWIITLLAFVAMPFMYFMAQRGRKIEIGDEGVNLGNTNYGPLKSEAEVIAAPILQFPEQRARELVLPWQDIRSMGIIRSVESDTPLLGVFRRPVTYFLAVATRKSGIYAVMAPYDALKGVGDALARFGRAGLFAGEKRLVMDQLRDESVERALRLLRQNQG